MDLPSTVFIIIQVTAYSWGSDWGYTAHDGPNTWPRRWEACGGYFQSPQDIETFSSSRSYEKSLKSTNYRKYYSATVKNNGHTAVLQLHAVTGETLPRIFGGNLPQNEVFEFSQLHWHWGSRNSVGSEHRLDSVEFSGEVHLVHYNLKYPNSTIAAEMPDGLAVLAFFLKVTKQANKHYIPITKGLKNLKQDQQVSVGYAALQTLITSTEETGYFFYEGSLTTPPCTENVFWTVFITPVRISESQIKVFRKLVTKNGVNLSDNNRPVQARNARQIRLHVKYQLPEDFALWTEE